MKITGRLTLAVGVLGSILGLAGPALAQGGHGGGGHGGGGHSGGGHSGGGHAMGASRGFSASHFGNAGHGFAGGGVSYGGGFRGGAVGAAHVGGYGHAGGYGYGYGHGGYSAGGYWRGGWWRGGYWPAAYYGLGFAWFLPFLPAVYSTYWYDGYPYYYANDVYYTWNPAYEGYVATDPPPVTDGSAGGGSAGGGSAGGEGAAVGAAPGGGPGAIDAGGLQVFMYPKNGQSDQQQSVDKRECQQWAASQVGQGQTGDYRRAMIACVEGRGYSAQ
jgi:hypothetical protein